MEIGGITNQYVFDQALMPGLVSTYNPFESAKAPGQNQRFAERLQAAAGRSNAAGAENAAQPVGKNSEIDRDSELFQACMELETFLLKNLISSMRNTVQKSGFLDTGFAGKFYEDMLYDEYARSFAKNAGFGFAEMAYHELNRKAQSLSF